MPRPWITILSYMALGSIVRGALWENPGWALTGSIKEVVGYDSNLTESNDGPDDFFVATNPTLTFFRRNSSTAFRVNADLTQTEFINRRQPAQTDFSFDAVYAYPYGKNVIPLFQSEASWTRSSPPNQYLGKRVKNEQFLLRSEVYFPLTGKLGLRGTTDFTHSHFDSDDLNKEIRGEAFLGLAFQRVEGRELSLNLGAALGHSIPNNPGRFEADVHNREYYITAKLRGEITPKVTGSAYIGFGRVEYTGGFTDQYSLPVGAIDLSWAIDPRRTLVLAAFSGAQYTPDGEAVKVTSASLSYTQTILGLWQYAVHAGPSHADFTRAANQRTDESWNLGVEFAYQPSDRFKLSLGFNYTNQDSDVAFTAFKRDVVSFGAYYHF